MGSDSSGILGRGLLTPPRAGSVERSVDSRERSYQELFENAAMGIARLALDGRLLEVNAAFAQILGRTPDELVGRHIKGLTHVEDWNRNADCFERALDGSITSYRLEKRYLHKDGSAVWCDISSRLVRDESGTPGYFIGVIFDISERKRLEAQLLQSQKLESLGRLASGVAHDFNNFLTVLMSCTDMAESSLGDPAELARCLANIRTVCGRAAGVTSQLLTFAHKRTEPGRTCDARQCLSETERLLEGWIGEDLRFDVRLPDHPIPIGMEHGRFQQILVNLAMNARDAMGDGGELTITLETVRLGGRPELELAAGDYAQISVRDTGVGMSEATLQRAFEPFFTTKEAGKGTGMGLASVYGHVRACRGAIEIESQLGHGTLVTFWLPLLEARELPSDPSRALEPATGGETVLVVEDEPAVRRVVSDALASRGYRVLSAGTRGEALAFARDHLDVALFLLDLVMPETNGRALAKELRALRPGVPTLFMSGYAPEAGNAEDRACDLLMKPFSVDELARAVRTNIARPVHDAAVEGVRVEV